MNILGTRVSSRHRVEVARLDICQGLLLLLDRNADKSRHADDNYGNNHRDRLHGDCKRAAIGRIEIPLPASQRMDRPGASFQTGMMIGRRRGEEARWQGSLRRGSSGIPDQLTERRAEVNADMKRDDGVTKPSERGLRYACRAQMVGLA